MMDTQKLKRKESKHNTKGIHQTTKEETKRRKTENYKNNKKTLNKMAVSIYLSILLLM